MADRVRRAVEALGMQHERNPHGVVTISVGCGALVPRPGQAPQILIRGADRSLYAAKQNGRNRFEIWNSAEAEEQAVPLGHL